MRTPAWILLTLFLFQACTEIETPERSWISDINLLEDKLPEAHLDFSKLSDPAGFSSELEDIKKRVPELEDYEIILELQKVVATLGVSHTGISIVNNAEFPRVPVQLELFHNGLFLTGALQAGEEAGTRQVTAINGSPVEEVIDKLSAYISYESPYWRDYVIVHLLMMPRVLKHAGMGASEDQIEYGLSGGGSLVLEADAEEGLKAYFSRLALQPWRQSADEYYNFRVIGDSCLHVQYNSCALDPDLSFNFFTAQIEEELAGGQISCFVLDLRLNTGGNSSVLNPLTEMLLEYPDLNYYAAISRQTYSSGTFALRDFKEQLGAMLIGEPSGGSPKSYGELKSFRLPYSGIKVYYCVKYFELTDSDLPYFEPDIPIPYLAEDYFTGSDPVMDYILDNEYE